MGRVDQHVAHVRSRGLDDTDADIARSLSEAYCSVGIVRGLE